MHLCMPVSVCADAYTFIYTCLDVSKLHICNVLFQSVCSRTHARTHACMHACMHVCVCVSFVNISLLVLT